MRFVRQHGLACLHLVAFANEQLRHEAREVRRTNSHFCGSGGLTHNFLSLTLQPEIEALA